MSSNRGDAGKRTQGLGSVATGASFTRPRRAASSKNKPRAEAGAPHEVSMVVVCEADVVTARIVGRDLALRAGLSGGDQAVVAAAISEVADNVLAFAGCGELTLRIGHRAGGPGVVVIASDNGPGIVNIESAVQDGFSTTGRQGLGLAGSKRLMDEFEIVSAPNMGTRVTMKKWRRDP